MSGTPLLPGLFPSCVATAEVRLGEDALQELHPEEAALLGSAVPARVDEFRAGRHCARIALARLGSHGAVIGRGADRGPLWPAGFTGSISHTRRGSVGYCCAAVARTSEARGLGVDVEADLPLERSLFERVLLPSERVRLSTVTDAEQGLLGKLVFSAKESVYKCQRPLSGIFLEFTDVEVFLEREAGRFRAVLGRDAGAFSRGATFEGRFAHANGLLLTAVTLA